MENITIKNKKISIFENHNEAVIPWSALKSLKPALLTFDYHTDTHLAFLRYNYKKLNSPEHYLIIKETEKMISQSYDVHDVVEILRNDEHIDFAIRANIISHAYVCSYNTSMHTIKSEEVKLWEKENLDPLKIFTNQQSPKPTKHTYLMPDNKIFELDKDHFQNMNIYSQKEVSDLSIDDRNLKHRLFQIQNINKSIFGKEYDFLDNFILDIDLDYFNTLNSINPSNFSIFYSLIRKAKLITIAKESYFVNECKLEDENINVSIILNRVLKHIESAVT